MPQLILPIQKLENPSFQGFYASGNNQTLVECLRKFASGQGEPFIYLWGHQATGCTHLLQACYQYAKQNGLQAAYHKIFSRGRREIWQALPSLETRQVLCLDDLDNLAGCRESQEAFFHFYNRFQAKGGYLLVGAKRVPGRLMFLFPDLVSRLSGGILFQVHELTDAEKLLALQQRAHLRGLRLSDKVGKFLLTHMPRDLSTLFATLDKLDTGSLVLKRKLTIPFVKAMLQL